jgi:RnfABCDGE-type electron transport complex C subunit
MSLLDKIKDAGVVGAGGAGFPTHVKLNTKADVVIVNGAECEPLLRVDQTLMDLKPNDIVEALQMVMQITQASRGVICLKGKYKSADKKLTDLVKDIDNIEVKIIRDYYPAGDEQQLIYEVTGKVIPTGGLPKDVGAVVQNVGTLLNIKEAMSDKPVTHKYVTITGAVESPMTVHAPIGTKLSELLEIAGAPKERDQYSLILGGPMMGKVTGDWDTPVTKTTGGVIVLPNTHSLICKKELSMERELRLAKAVCCQCSRCTQMCPRNDLGLGTSPNKVMVALAMGQYSAMGNVNTIFSCCGCDLCTQYACDMGLSPGKVMSFVKTSLLKEGVKPKQDLPNKQNINREYKLIPTMRLIKRLGIYEYDRPAPLKDGSYEPQQVTIPMKQHIGAPSEAIVKVSDRVNKGDLIAKIPEKSLGANIHASIDGKVVKITDDHIVIERV